MQGHFRLGPWLVQPSLNTVSRNDRVVRLTPKVMQVLVCLVEHAGEPLSKQELLRTVWQDTFVGDDVLKSAISELRRAFEDDAKEPRIIETIAKRGYRLITPTERVNGANGNSLMFPGSVAEASRWRTALLKYRFRVLPVVLLVVIALFGAGIHARHPLPNRLTQKDTIVLADIDNRTGDVVFDDTLREVLGIQLRQSPFLNLVPDQQIQESLRFMGRSPDERVTGRVAQEICQRQNAKAVLQGSLKGIGSHYVLQLNTTNCQTGEPLAEEEAEVANKEQVIAALGSMAARMRKKLGESLVLVEQYDAPVLQATTSSLPALKAYSLGVAEQERGEDAGAIPFFKRAVELDPNFALAYMRLYIAYWDTGEYETSREYAKKAFALREHVSEREKLAITALYHDIVTGDLEQIYEADQLWAKTYPREWLPHASLATNYDIVGFFDKALEESTAMVRLAPHSAFPYANIALAYQGLNRWHESRLALERLITNSDDGFFVYSRLFMAAFAEGDKVAMQKYLHLTIDNLPKADTPRFEFSQAEIAAFHGRLRSARELTESAIRSAEQDGLKQNAAAMVAREAVWEADVGNLRHARKLAKQALVKARGIDVEVNAALALAIAGDRTDASAVAHDLALRHPEDTVLQGVSLPLIRSANMLARGIADPAIESLVGSERYELGFGLYYYPPLMPTYVRAQSYLHLREGAKATSEFQKILDHRGVAPASPVYVLAHLGLGRARASSGDVPGARKEYLEFFNLWKDADPDTPILKQAKAEYAELQ